jgi:hypothetical protein
MGDTTVLVTGNAPPGRNGHSATLAADPSDEENGRIIIIGGWLGTGPLAASDMHVLDISNGGLRLRWYQVSLLRQYIHAKNDGIAPFLHFRLID